MGVIGVGRSDPRSSTDDGLLRLLPARTLVASELIGPSIGNRFCLNATKLPGRDRYESYPESRLLSPDADLGGEVQSNGSLVLFPAACPVIGIGVAAPSFTMSLDKRFRVLTYPTN